MKRKIIAIGIISMFLLMSITTLSAEEARVAEDERQMNRRHIFDREHLFDLLQQTISKVPTE